MAKTEHADSDLRVLAQFDDDTVVIIKGHGTFHRIGRRGGGHGSRGPGRGPGATAPVVDGQTGAVIAIAHQDPETGQWEYVDPETTTVIRTGPSGGDGETGPVIGGSSDDAPPFDDPGAGSSPVEADAVTDGLHVHVRLQCPGNLSNTVFEESSALFNPRNNGNAVIWIASFDSQKNVIEGTKVALQPGEGPARYDRAPGAKYIGYACGSGPDVTTTELVYQAPIS